MGNTRSVLLRAGFDLLVDARDVSALKLQAIVDRAELTSGAFYNHWATLADYQADLLTYAFIDQRATHSDDVRDAIMSELLDPRGLNASFPELVRRHAQQDRQKLASDPGFRLWLALWARRGDDPETAAIIQTGYTQVDERWCRLYGSVLRRYGLELREPFDERRLSVVLTALLEGLVVRGAVDPDSVPTGLHDPERPEADWDLFSLAVIALLPALTRPIDSKDDRNVWHVAEEALKPTM